MSGYIPKLRWFYFRSASSLRRPFGDIGLCGRNAFQGGGAALGFVIMSIAPYTGTGAHLMLSLGGGGWLGEVAWGEGVRCR